MDHWSIDEVCNHFAKLGATLDELRRLRNERIDGAALLMMEDSHLKDDLKFPLGLRLKHLNFIDNLPTQHPTSPELARLAHAASAPPHQLVAKEDDQRERADDSKKMHADLLSVFEKAKAGDANSQNTLGVAYANGEKVTKDVEQAIKWFQPSAAQGFAKAQHNVGYSYYIGLGVEKDREVARVWFKRAADQGLADAQYMMGVLVHKDANDMISLNKAKSWLRRAADQGHQHAKLFYDRIKHEFIS